MTAAVGGLQQRIHRARVRPAPQVDQDVPAGPALHARGPGEVGRRRAHDIEEIVPARHDVAAKLCEVGFCQPTSAGGRSARRAVCRGSYHPFILP